jgi:hypothetical protein
MQQLLCEPEDRLGSQGSVSVSRPNSMIVQARRSGFIAAASGSGSVDGAEHIKVTSAQFDPRVAQFETDILVFARLTRSSGALIGQTSIDTLPRIAPSFATLRTHDILTQTFRQRYVSHI